MDKKNDNIDTLRVYYTKSCTSNYFVKKVKNRKDFGSFFELTNNENYFIVENKDECPTLLTSLNPPFNNIMGYWETSIKSCEDIFTQGQITRIQQGKYYRTSYAGVTAYNIFSAPLLNPANAKPTGLQTTILSTLNKVTWSNVTGNVGYIIERSTSSNSGFVAVGGVGPNITYFTDNTFSLTTEFYYRVRCSNSTRYSDPIFSGLCTPQFQTVTLYTNSAGTIKLNKWDAEYANKVIKYGLMDKTKIVSLSVATKPTLGEAAEAVILTAKKLWSNRYSSLVKVCYDENKYSAYLNEIKNLQVSGIASSTTPNQEATLSQVAEMVWKVILNGSGESTVALNLPASYKGNNTDFVGTGIAKELANVKVPIFKKNSNQVTFKSKEFLLGKKNVITRDILAKIIANAYEIKNNAIGGTSNGRVSSELASNEFADDISTLSYKDEFDTDVPDATPTLQITGASEIIQSGAQWWIDMTPTGFGNNVQFYWTVEGALQGARLDPFPASSNYQKIYFSAPIVTTETIVNMVIYAASDDGKAVEMYKQFKVVPIPNNGCISLLTPNISFDRVVGSPSTTKYCNFKNGSSSSSTTLSFQITGPNASNFSRLQTTLGLTPNQQSSIEVYCDAGTVGTYTATLEITQTGLSGCPTKMMVPLLANVTATTSEPGLTWLYPQGGETFYSGGMPNPTDNYVGTNTGGTYMEYSLNNDGWLPYPKECYSAAFIATFPAGTFASTAKFRVRKKDCTISGGMGYGNFVESPSFRIINNPNSNINVIYPNGTEILTGNQMYEIKWSGSSTSLVTLQYSTDGGVTFPNTIATNLNAVSGTYNWVVPILPNYENDVRIKIISGTFSDVSDGNFTIKRPMLLNPTVQQGCDDKGQILITSSGGKYPHTYLVTPGNYTTTDVRALNTGTYTVKVTDATGEAIQTNVTIPTYTPRNFTFDKIDATCGGKNGVIRITGFSSGFTPTRFSYSKNGNYIGVFDTEISNLEAGRYEINAFQYVGVLSCGVYKTIDINPDNNFNLTSVIGDASCVQSDGVITLTSSIPATYLWENGATINSVSNLQQGTQFVTVKNIATNCNLPLSFEVRQKPNFIVSSLVNLSGSPKSSMAGAGGRLYFRTYFSHPNTTSIDTVSCATLTQNTVFSVTNTVLTSGANPNFRIRSISPINFRGSTFDNIKPLIEFYDINYPFAVKTTSYNEQQQFTNTFFNGNNINYSIIGLIQEGFAINSNNRNEFFQIKSNGIVIKSVPNGDRVRKLLYNGSSNLLTLTNPSISGGLNKVYVFETNALNELTSSSFSIKHFSLGMYSSSFHPLFIASQDLSTSKFYIEIYESTSFAYRNKIELPEGISSNENFLTADSKYLYVVLSSSKIAIIDYSTYNIIKILDVGMYVESIYYDLNTKRIFCYNGSGGLKYFTVAEPTLSITPTKTDVACSQNGSIALTVSGGGTPTYSWSNGATTKDISNLITGTYTVTVTPSDGTCALKKSIKIENIGITPTATVSSPSSKTSFCIGENVQLVANQGADLTYQWQKDGIDISSATQQTYYTTTTGSYRVKVKNSTGCETISSALPMTANTVPIAAITPLSSTTICEGSSVILRGNTAVNQSYVWLKDDAVLQGQTGQDFASSSAGSYQLITILNGCSNLSSGVNISVTPFSQIIHGAGTLAANLYQGQTITSQANVPNRAFYRGGKSILLNAGFQAGANELFLAEIGGCVAIPTNGLVLYLPFTGNTNDASGNNNNGINHGATLTTDRKGNANAAYNFGGTSNSNDIQVLNSTSLQFTTEFTISVWYSLNSYAGMNGSQQIVTNGVQTLFAKDFDTGGFYGRVFSDAATNSMKLDFVGVPGPTNFMIFPNFGDMATNLNKWIHLVYVLSNGHLKVFKDGVLLQDRILTSTINFATANTKDLYFGRYRGGLWYPLNGKLDDIRIYNRALTDNEVQSIYTIER